MTIKTKKVYYCDFCKKHRLRSLQEHEKYCTANPDRECGLCKDNKNIKKLFEKYKKIDVIEKEGTIKFSVEPEDIMKSIIMDVDSCPNCCLNILRIVFGKTGKNVMWCFYYDYKKSLQEWWNRIDEQELINEMRY